jgi:hypothetical protein
MAIKRDWESYVSLRQAELSAAARERENEGSDGFDRLPGRAHVI